MSRAAQETARLVQEMRDKSKPKEATAKKKPSKGVKKNAAGPR